MGICIIIIESNFQLFRAITFNAMTDIFIKGVTQPAYKGWAYRNRGTVASKTFSGKVRYFATLALVLVARLAGGFDFFQSFMQYLMSITNISVFAEQDGWRHVSSPECNVVDGFTDYDDRIAVLASYEAWIVLFPAIYEVSKILIPGIPKHMEAVAEDAVKKRDPKTSWLHIFKYGSVVSPDLWLSKLASMWIRAVHLATPLTTARNEIGYVGEHIDHEIRYITYKVAFEHGVSVRKEPSYEDSAVIIAEVDENELVETCSDLQTVELVAPSGQKVVWMQLISHYDGWVPLHSQDGDKVFELVAEPERVQSSPLQVPIEAVSADDIKLDEMEGAIKKGERRSSVMHYSGEVASMLRIQSQTMKFNNCYRVVSCGEQSNATVECGLYFALPGYSRKVWASYNDLHVAENAFHLCSIDRMSGEIDYARTYDIIGNGHTTEGRRLRHLVWDLNQATDDKIIIVFSTGTPGTYHRKRGGLGSALERCGSTGSFYKETLEDDAAYILIGIPGCGSGGGYEVIQGGGKAANIDLSFEVTKDGFDVQEIDQGVFDNYCCCSNKSFIFAAFHERTAEENLRWKERQKKTMPSYFTLCRLEHQEICQWFGARVWRGFQCSWVAYIMAFIGLGHFTTSIGRQTWYCVIWKIVRFFGLCLGYWTDDVVELYGIHRHIREMSVVWDKPFKRKSREVYDAYRTLLKGDKKKEEEESAKSGKPKKKFKDYFISLPEWMTPEGGWIEDSSSHEETEEMIDAQQEDLKRKLRANYAATLHAIIATRGVLLQAFPSLSLLSIYATTMSATPIMVHSKRLAHNLPELIISEPFVEARAQEQELIDEQEWIRRANLTETQNCTPNPEYKIVKGVRVRVPKSVRDQIEAGNAYNRARMKKIIDLPSRTVDEWIVAINGTILYVTESRGINFLINLYKYILTVGMLFTAQDKLKYWMGSAVIILLPLSILVALGAVAVMGKTLYITDEDLEKALACVGMSRFFRWVLHYTGSQKKLTYDSEAEAEASHKEKDAFKNSGGQDGAGGGGGSVELTSAGAKTPVQFGDELQAWVDASNDDNDDAADDDDDADKSHAVVAAAVIAEPEPVRSIPASSKGNEEDDSEKQESGSFLVSSKGNEEDDSEKQENGSFLASSKGNEEDDSEKQRDVNVEEGDASGDGNNGITSSLAIARSENEASDAVQLEEEDGSSSI